MAKTEQKRGVFVRLGPAELEWLGALQKAAGFLPVSANRLATLALEYCAHKGLTLDQLLTRPPAKARGKRG
jgi:hypothetical protein